jgi:hypothetical protein
LESGEVNAWRKLPAGLLIESRQLARKHGSEKFLHCGDVDPAFFPRSVRLERFAEPAEA